MMRIMLFTFFTTAALCNDSFVIEFKAGKIKVESQSKRGDFVGLLVKNSTFKPFIGALKNRDKTIRRFTIKPGRSKSFQVQYSEFKKLYYINLSPASETLPLVIGKKDYEIPKKR